MTPFEVAHRIPLDKSAKRQLAAYINGSLAVALLNQIFLA
jgi:hypothetical protein